MIVSYQTKKLQISIQPIKIRLIPHYVVDLRRLNKKKHVKKMYKLYVIGSKIKWHKQFKMNSV